MNEPAKKLIRKVFLDNYQKFIKAPQDERKKISDEIDRLNSRISLARNKLLSEVITDEEYLEIKKEYKDQVEKLETQFNDKPIENKVDIPKLLEKALETLTNIWKVYTEGDIAVKRQIIGAIFPEKLEFDGNHYRTARINTVAYYIFQLIMCKLPNFVTILNDKFFHFLFIFFRTYIP
ncbi:hypothetical protein [Chryseobacterium artocarpi]|uniref:hypothetical protein n=1 Tax=Chryseobacterium artocarpi TaxID=1414727 RepID=UPI003F3889BE